MTPERYARIREMLAARQPDLTVCMEQVHKPHNVSAVIRTADAVGVHEIHAVWPTTRMKTLVSSAAGSNSWVQVKTHKTIQEAVSLTVFTLITVYVFKTDKLAWNHLVGFVFIVIAVFFIFKKW